jgi:predicted dehydrogenase
VSKISLCLVGAGGMGSRHIGGMALLKGHGLSNFDLVAVCDLRRDNAERVAAQAEKELGRRPEVLTSLADAAASRSIDGFIVATEAFSHIAVVPDVLKAGKHVLCEKPLALTVRSCRALTDAAEQSGAILATAENYRRDPTNRLAKAAMDAGLVGDVLLMSQIYLGGGREIIITPWRHDKDKGAIGLDMGVHFTDLFQYYLGPFESIFGRGFIAEPIRYRRNEPELNTEAYRARLAEMPETVTPTGEDSVLALFRMASGISVQLSYIHAGSKTRQISRVIHGREGFLDIPMDRTGGKVVLRTDKLELSGKDILKALPGFQLDPVTAAIFGPEGVEYTMGPVGADAGLLAIEQHDFCEAIRTSTRPEVDGYDGTTAVAALLGVYESDRARRPVSMQELLASQVDAYQRDTDQKLGLISERTAS